MQRHPRAWIVLWSASLLVATFHCGCGDDDATPPTDAGEIDAPAADAAALDAGDDDAGSVDAGQDAGVCNQVWVVESSGGPDVAAMVEAGSLVVSARNIAPGTAPIAVYQANLTGDFEGGFFYDMFDAAGPGAYAQAVVGLGMTDYAIAGVGTVPSIGVGAAVFHPGSPPATMVTPTSATAGFMRFKRTGDVLEVTSSAGADMALVTDVLVGGPLRIGIQIGNSGTDMVGGVTLVRLTDFRMSGGGGEVTSDSFDCDSIQR